MLKYLKHFKYISTEIGKENDVTLPSAVVLFKMLIDKVESIIFELDNKSDRSKSDEVLLLAFQKGRDKMLKHYRKCNWVYSVSLILDPRHKVDGFSTTAWGKDLKKFSVQKFKEIYQHEYYDGEKTESAEVENIEKKIDDDHIDLNSIYIYKKKMCQEVLRTVRSMII